MTFLLTASLVLIARSGIDTAVARFSYVDDVPAVGLLVSIGAAGAAIGTAATALSYYFG